MSYYYMVSPRSDYLAHYGVKERSGRYKWGTGERPRQRLEQPKRMGFFARRKEQKRQAEILAKKKQLLDEARKQQEEKAKLKAEKERILREANPIEIKKYATELTNAELQDACNRIQWMNALNSYAAKEERNKQGKTTFEHVDDFMTKLGKVNKWGETGLNTYKNVSAVIDALQKSAAKSQISRETGEKNPYIRMYNQQKETQDQQKKSKGGK